MSNFVGVFIFNSRKLALKRKYADIYANKRNTILNKVI